MIIDCFTFFNELDLLEGRLEYLYDHVDYFVISESNLTHTGKPKPLNFLNNMSRYKPYLDKIMYFPWSKDISGMDFSPPNGVNYESAHWELERGQRDHISQALKFFDVTDICLISDLDEIPNHEAILEVKNLLRGHAAVSLPQEMFMYNLNQKQFLPWVGTVATRVGIALDQGPSMVRSKRWSEMLVVPFVGGWHLTYWGGAEKIQSKISNFAHQELINDKTTDIEYIQSRIDAGQDIFERELPYLKTNPYDEPKAFLKAFGKYVGINIEN